MEQVARALAPRRVITATSALQSYTDTLELKRSDEADQWRGKRWDSCDSLTILEYEKDNHSWILSMFRWIRISNCTLTDMLSTFHQLTGFGFVGISLRTTFTL